MLTQTISFGLLVFFTFLAESLGVSNQQKSALKASFITDAELNLAPTPETPFETAYPEGSELTSKEICINLREILISFSNDATNFYENCDESIHLLGNYYVKRFNKL